ncbi:MAG: aromatic ring-hydroxylating dioxygenase subunit alpha [Myxococcales bacterium]|nr:aromatic ring-hydroxylating dioxygenase subunit alpha [Myxococcales bacterium]
MSVRKPSPPSFDDARNRRQKVRSAGLDPNYWYAVEHDHKLGKGEAVEVTFWGESVALWRDENGALHAIEDRCCHRQLRLSQGEVRGCQLVCKYHGWCYDGSGEVVDIPHETFGRKKPALRVRQYPLRVRYGLIWIFFGDPARADGVPMPEIPELEGDDRWACVPVDFTWNAHHSMIIDNVSDFTHAYLHKKYKPFDGASKLTRLVEEDDRVLMSYDTKVGGGKISGMFVDRKAVDTSSMDLGYQYPYQWSNTDNAIKHWCLVLPESEERTRVFFLFYFKSFKVPLTPLKIPRWLMTPFLRISNELLVKPLLAEDGWAVEEEQEGWRRHWDAPIAELNPAVHAMQTLTIRKWEEYLASQQGESRRPRLSAEG